MLAAVSVLCYNLIIELEHLFVIKVGKNGTRKYYYSRGAAT